MLTPIKDKGDVSYQRFTDAAELQFLDGNDLAVLLSARFSLTQTQGGGTPGMRWMTWKILPNRHRRFYYERRFRMKLSGKVSPDLCLLVLALTEEAQSLDTGLPVLLTGIGKVNAACALAGVLGRGPLPARIVNLGTTRALRPGLNGIHRVNTVIQHDLDTDVLRTSALLDLDDGRLAAMDGAGIDTAVLSLTTPGLQNLAGTEAVALQGPTNDATATAGPVTVTAAGLARWGLIGAIGEPGTAG